MEFSDFRREFAKYRNVPKDVLRWQEVPAFCHFFLGHYSKLEYPYFSRLGFKSNFSHEFKTFQSKILNA